jgi:hypothetical protein
VATLLAKRYLVGRFDLSFDADASRRAPPVSTSIRALEGEAPSASREVRTRLTQFVRHVFDHVAGKQISVGRFLGPDEAEAHVLAHLDRS